MTNFEDDPLAEYDLDDFYDMYEVTPWGKAWAALGAVLIVLVLGLASYMAFR
jgi:hypothetical protein